MGETLTSGVGFTITETVVVTELQVAVEAVIVNIAVC